MRLHGRIVKNAREVWRHNSLQAMVAVGALQGWWALTPQAWIDAYPKWVTPAVAYATAIMTVAAVAFKYLKQDLPSDKAPTP